MTRTAPLAVAPPEPPAADPAPKATSRARSAAKVQIPENLSPDLRLVIEEDPSRGTYIYKTVNRVTGEVLQQFPREDLLKMQTDDAYTPGRVVSTDA